MIEILIGLQTLLVLAGVGFYIYKNMPKPDPAAQVVIERLPENLTKGFGYIKGKSLVLNAEGVPYLYKTYGEAKNKMERVEGVSGIVYQQWDMDTQQVFIGEVRWDKQMQEE
jgi:hypothetical protein